jgi:hypothetical protein
MLSNVDDFNVYQNPKMITKRFIHLEIEEILA